MIRASKGDVSEGMASDSGKLPSASVCRTRHYWLAEKMIRMVEQALTDELEPYRYVETLKDGNATVLDCSTLGAFNEVRMGRIVKLLADLFEMQRTALGIPCVKEKHDAQNAKHKLEQELYLGRRKLDIELLKLERAAAVNAAPNGEDAFWAALGAVDLDDAEVYDDADTEDSA